MSLVDPRTRVLSTLMIVTSPPGTGRSLALDPLMIMAFHPSFEIPCSVPPVILRMISLLSPDSRPMMRPTTGAPAGWPPCDGRCPKPPTVDIEACWATMPCPRSADKRVRACKPSDFPPCPDKKNPDQNNPNCLVPAAPVVGRVIGRDIQGGDTVLKIGAGKDQGIAPTGWRAMIVDGNGNPVPGGEVKIVRVDTSRTVGKTRLTAGQVEANPYVKFVPSK